jgi:hypothetical protein
MLNVALAAVVFGFGLQSSAGVLACGFTGHPCPVFQILIFIYHVPQSGFPTWGIHLVAGLGSQILILIFPTPVAAEVTRLHSKAPKGHETLAQGNALGITPQKQISLSPHNGAGRGPGRGVQYSS